MVVVIYPNHIMIEGFVYEINYYGTGKNVVIIQTGEPTHNYKSVSETKKALGLTQSDMLCENYMIPR